MEKVESERRKEGKQRRYYYYFYYLFLQATMTSMKQIGNKSKLSEIDSSDTSSNNSNDDNNNNSIIRWEKFNSNELNLKNCRNTLLDKFENLANQFAAGWKYHISNTDGIKEAWISFEDFYTEMCLLAIERESLSGEIVRGEIEPRHINGLLSTYTITDEYRTPEQCDELLTKKVDALASKLSPNWTNVVANINDTSKAWKDFKSYFQQICAHGHS
uniref:Myb_DNA-bind_3 domain-containing protein n=1 Tax=Elaeophora elaphi TaxID=1147741 RepID=A0A0R3RP64_9BILA